MADSRTGRLPQRSALFLAFLYSASSPLEAVAGPTSAKSDTSLEEQAVAAGRHGDWQTALTDLDAAIAANPQSAELYFLRASACIELTRPDVSSDALANPRGHDLARASAMLRKANADLARYLELSPDAPGKAQIQAAIQSTESRAGEVTAIAERMKAADEAAAAHDAERRRLAREAVEKSYATKKADAVASRRLGWITVSVGALSGVGAIVCGALWAKGVSDIRAGGFATASDIDSAASRTDLESKLTLGFAAGAGVFAATGAIIVLLSPNPERPSSVSVVAAPGGLVLTSSF